MPYKLLPPGKRGPCWYVRGTDASGPFEYSTGKDDRRAAARWVEEVFLPDRAGRRVPGRGEVVGFKTAAQHYKAANPHLSKSDIALIDALADEIDEADCRSVGRHTLVAAADVLKPGASPATKNRKVIAPGAAVLHYAAEQRWCEYQRIKKFWESRKSNREPASDDTLAKLVDHLEDPPEDLAPQWRAKGGVDPNLPYKRLLIAVLYELGLRITDYLSIEWPHIDLQAGTVRVRIGKTDDWAILELSPVIVSMLANLPGDHSTGRLFPWTTRRGVYAWLDRVRKRAKVHYTPHLSRHAMATDAGIKRIPDAEAAKLGAWQDPRSLHRYQHVQPKPIPGRDAGFLAAVGTKRGKVA
jgi:integrase